MKKKNSSENCDSFTNAFQMRFDKLLNSKVTKGKVLN